MSPATPTTTPASPRHPRWRRWTVRLALALASLFLFILILGQIIFLTNLPRDLVVHGLEKQLGLRVTAESLATGWLGHTTLHDVTLALPLADRPFLVVPTLRIRHSPLAWFILSGSLTIHQMVIDDARLHVIQQPSGEWNVQQVALLLAGPGSGKKPAANGRNIPQWPEIQIHNATLIITDNKRRQAVIAPLGITGRSLGPVVWQFQAAVPNQLDLTGKIAPGGIWGQEISLRLGHAQNWFSPWIASWPPEAHLDAHWRGWFDAERLTGRVDLQSATFGSTTLAGPIEVAVQNSQAIFRPAGLLLAHSPLSARFDNGQIIVHGGDIQSRQLAVQFTGGRASIDGGLTLANGTGTLHAVVNTNGSVKAGQWDGQIVLDGTGNNLGNLSLVITAPELRLESNDHQAIEFHGSGAHIAARGDTLLIQDIHLGQNHPISGQGGYVLSTGMAWLWLEGRGWHPPPLAAATLDLDLNIWSEPGRIHLDQFFLRSGGFQAWLDGDYVYNRAKPVSARLYLDESSSSPAGAPPQSLHGNIDVAGALRPLNLTLSGQADGQNIHLGQHSLGDLRLVLAGDARDGRLSLASRDFQFLGGAWHVAGHWPAKDRLLRLDTVSVKHLSLPLLLAGDNVGGQLDGNCVVDIHRFAPQAIAVTGQATISNLSVGDPHKIPAAERPTIDLIQIPDIQIHDGDIQLKPITLQRQMSGITGRAQAELSTTMAHPNRLSLTLRADSWPIHPGMAKALCILWTKGKLDIDLARPSALGHLDLRANTTWAGQALGAIDAAIDAQGRSVQATRVQLHLLDGSAGGQASFDLDNPWDTRAKLDWQNLDLGRLKTFSPLWAELAGKVNGSCRIGPATAPHPLEPLAISLRAQPSGGQYQHIPIGALQMFAYLGPHRFVLDDDPARASQIGIAGGMAQFWGRISQPCPDIHQAYVQINLHNLDLNAVLPPGTKVARTPGLLSGQITIIGQPAAAKLAFGQGHLVLERTDLAGTGPIAFLYTLLHLGHNANRPVGSGAVDFTIENQSILISALRYFDRGAEVRGSGVINDILALPHSQTTFILVGSVRPLNSIELPGVPDIDQALAAIQRGVLSVKISGPLDQLNSRRFYHVIPFSDIGHDLQNLLVGDARAEQQ